MLIEYRHPCVLQQAWPLGSTPTRFSPSSTSTRGISCSRFSTTETSIEWIRGAEALRRRGALAAIDRGLRLQPAAGRLNDCLFIFGNCLGRPPGTADDDFRCAIDDDVEDPDQPEDVPPGLRQIRIRGLILHRYPGRWSSSEPGLCVHPGGRSVVRRLERPLHSRKAYPIALLGGVRTGGRQEPQRPPILVVRSEGFEQWTDPAATMKAITTSIGPLYDPVRGPDLGEHLTANTRLPRRIGQERSIGERDQRLRDRLALPSGRRPRIARKHRPGFDRSVRLNIRYEGGFDLGDKAPRQRYLSWRDPRREAR